jgi:hypothetical protein
MGKHSAFSFNPSIVDGSPSERIDYSFHIRKIIDQKVRLIFGKLIATPCAGRHGDRARAQRFTAGNIPRCIADYIDLGGRELAAMLLFRARPGEWSKPVTIPMIICKRAKFEKVPDTVVLEL